MSAVNGTTFAWAILACLAVAIVAEELIRPKLIPWLRRKRSLRRVEAEQRGQSSAND
jgi:hypothetical protein